VNSDDGSQTLQNTSDGSLPVTGGSDEIIGKATDPTARIASRGGRGWRRWGSGLVVSIVCVVIGARLVDWRRALIVVADSDPVWLLVYVGTLICAFAIFAVRWRMFIYPQAARPTVPRLLGYLMIGYMSNALLPLRPGDLFRASFLRQRHRVPVAAALSSIVLERVFDVLAVLMIGGVLLLVLPVPEIIARGLVTFAAAALAGTAGLCLLIVPNPFLSLFERLIERVKWPPVRIVSTRLSQFQQAGEALVDPRQIGAVALLTFAGWFMVSCGAASVLFALHVNAPLIAGAMVVVVTSLGAAIPSSPGSIGVFHFLAALALTIWGVDKETAAAYAIVLHAVASLAQIGGGAAAAWIIRPGGTEFGTHATR